MATVTPLPRYKMLGNPRAHRLLRVLEGCKGKVQIARGQVDIVYRFGISIGSGT